MKQSRRMSFVEAVANVGIGFVVAFVSNLVVLPLFGLHPTISSALGIGAVYTLISIGRNYSVRRLFERFRPRPSPNPFPEPMFVTVRQAHSGATPELVIGRGGGVADVVPLSVENVKRLARETVNAALR